MRSSEICPDFPNITVSESGRVGYSVILGLTTLLGLIYNILLFIAIFLNRKSFFRNQVYELIFSMAIICSIYFFGNFLVAIPVLVNSYEYLESPTTMKTLSSLNTFGHYTEQLILLIISLNRCLIIGMSVKKNTSRRAFEFLNAACWIYGLLITIVPSLLGCFKVFSPKTLNFTFSCANCGLMFDYYMISGEAAPIIMISLYSLMVIRLRSLQKQLQKRDLHLTIQCFLICFFSWLASFFFFFLPKFFEGSFASSILILTVSTVSKTANPVILFVFNVKIRDAIGTFVSTGKAIPPECITSTVYFKKPCKKEPQVKSSSISLTF